MVQFRRVIVVLVLSLALFGCASFRIGEPYDQSIDDGLNDFQKTSAGFIKSMELSAGTAKGAYTSDEAKTYYASAASTLSNLQLKAAILSNRTCPVSDVARFVQPLTDALNARVSAAEAKLGVSGGATQPDLSGNCMVLILRDLQLAEADLERDHKDHGKLTPLVGQINQEAIDGAVRIALTALRANKF